MLLPPRADRVPDHDWERSFQTSLSHSLAVYPRADGRATTTPRRGDGDVAGGGVGGWGGAVFFGCASVQHLLHGGVERDGDVSVHAGVIGGVRESASEELQPAS